MRLLPFAVALLCTVAFAGDPVPFLSGSMRLSDRDGFGFACAIAPDVVITARHVAFMEDGTPLRGFRWSSDYGTEGRAALVADWPDADLALLKLEAPLPEDRLNPAAAQAPKAGSDVWWYEYDWSKRERAYKLVIRHGVVGELFAGKLAIDKETAVPGSSGGCIVNAAGETVGIMSGGVGVDVGSAASNTVAVYGTWGERVLREAREALSGGGK